MDVDEQRTDAEHQHTKRSAWIEIVMATLAIIGVLTIVIGGSVVIVDAFDDDYDDKLHEPFLERGAESEPLPVQRCYEEVVRRGSGGGLFGDLDDQEHDDFDAESEFADSRQREVIIVCE